MGHVHDIWLFIVNVSIWTSSIHDSNGDCLTWNWNRSEKLIEIGIHPMSHVTPQGFISYITLLNTTTTTTPTTTTTIKTTLLLLLLLLLLLFIEAINKQLAISWWLIVGHQTKTHSLTHTHRDTHTHRERERERERENVYIQHKEQVWV